MYEFEFRTGKVTIDHEKCKDCKSYACVKACSLYGRAILRIRDGRPVLSVSPEEAKRLCIECLACELQCELKGKKGLKLNLPMPGGND
jgi:dissimilatory sulfite reductase (desulfoviridin) alpha/beta subunit